MLALTVDSAKNIAIVVVVGLAIAAILSAKFVANVTKKAIMLLVFGALALGVWSQRQSLQTCADKVQAGLGATSTKCTFLGKEITFPTAP